MLRAMNRPALLACLALCHATAALADDAADRKDGDAQLAEAARRLEAACGKPIAASYDWASEAAAPGKPAYQGPVYCKDALGGLASACADEMGKAVISENVRSVACKLEPGASKKSPTGGPLLALEGNKVIVVYDWASGNMDSDTQKWAMKKMLTPGPNGPATIEAKAERKEGEKQFAEAVTAFQKQCGNIKVSYDFASEKGNDAKPAWQGYYYCRNVLQGLGNACETQGKKAVAEKKFNAIECRFEANASKRKDLDPEYQGAAHVLKGKTLTVLYDWTNGNLDSAAQKWLTKLK
jgi:hypothetical protein